MVVKTSDSPNKANEIPQHARVTQDASGGTDPEHDKLATIRDRFMAMSSYWSIIHETALEDDNFMAGEQWPEQVRKDREEARRPILTYNLLPSFTRQILNKVRQERPQVRVTPVESDRFQTPDMANVQGTQDYSLADVFMGIIRNIEHRSRADHSYDTALQHAVHHGFGYFIVKNQESRHDPFVQELVIKRVKNSYQVLMDPAAQEADLSDAADAFVFSSIHRATFERKYPDATYSSFDAGTMMANYEGWYEKENLRIAEYRWIEYKQDEVLQLSNGKIVYWSDVEDVLDDMQHESGVHIVEIKGKQLRKKVKRPVCMWQKMTADEILEGPLELPFETIPIFPVLGDEMIVDGRTRYESAIRHAKDAQRSYNYWRTAAAETVALAPRAPLVATARQIAGYEHLYETANTENHPYLLYNHIDGVPPPVRLQPAGVAAAELANAGQDAVDMQTIIGLHEANLGAESNEKSGKAILARQAQGTISTFIFPDNLNRALESMGRCLVYAIPRIYDTQRVLRIRLPDDTEDFVEINKTITDKDTGDEYLVNDINYGRYDVVIETGPAYATQRQEALDTQMELLKVLPPEIAQNVIHLIVKNMAMPGSEEIGRILRKMLPDDLKSEDDRAADLPKGVTFDDDGNMVKDGEPYEPEPTAQEQFAQRQQELAEAEIDAKMAESEADMKQAEAKMAQAQADLKEAELALANLNAGAEGEEQQPDYKAMLGPIEELIKQAFADHETDQGAHKGQIDEQIAEGITDALDRVKKYVEKRVAQAAQGQPKLAPVAPTEKPSNVVELSRAPMRFKIDNIERGDDGEGRITSAEVVVLNTQRKQEK